MIWLSLSSKGGLNAVHTGTQELNEKASYRYKKLKTPTLRHWKSQNIKNKRQIATYYDTDELWNKNQIIYDTLWNIKPWIKSIDWGFVSQYINILAVPVERVKTQCSERLLLPTQISGRRYNTCPLPIWEPRLQWHLSAVCFSNRLSIPISKEYATEGCHNIRFSLHNYCGQKNSKY